MKSSFKHKHAADYMEAWTLLSNRMMFHSMENQLDILSDARREVMLMAQLRMNKRMSRAEHISYTDTELAQLAAIDEHLFARSGERGKSPSERGEYTVEIGQEGKKPGSGPFTVRHKNTGQMYTATVGTESSDRDYSCWPLEMKASVRIQLSPEDVEIIQ